MRLFLPLYLIISICILGGCKGIQMSQQAPITKIPNTYFNREGEEYFYRIHVDAYEHQLSGVLAMKRIDKEECRIFISSDFGQKIADFSIVENRAIFHYLTPSLDRKFIKKILEEDFSTLFSPHYDVIKIIPQKQEDATAEYQILGGTLQKDEGLITKIVIEKKKKKNIFHIQPKTINFAGGIHISHDDVPIKISLELL